MNAESNNVTPDVRHFAALADAYTLCGLERATVRWTDDPATPVDCPDCTVAIVDEQFGPDGKTAAEMASETTEPQPERRTVSLEVLTDELRALAAEEYDGDDAVILEGATVGIVGRIGGRADAVTDVDSDWFRSGIAPGQVLAGMMQQARGRAQSAGAALLMPTPDVLAALDGHRSAGFWTAPVPITCRWIEPGWIVVGYSGPGVEERVEAKATDCGEADCPWPGDCTLLTIGDSKPQHFADWSTLTVRIPAAAMNLARAGEEVAGGGVPSATAPAESCCGQPGWSSRHEPWCDARTREG